MPVDHFAMYHLPRLGLSAAPEVPAGTLGGQCRGFVFLAGQGFSETPQLSVALRPYSWASHPWISTISLTLAVPPFG